MTKFLVVGHSDADGHVIAEQTRRNLSHISNNQVDLFVDAQLTSGHRAWKTVDQINQVSDADVIVFVDMMFSPIGFAEESSALVQLAKRNSEKTFIVIDHHPLPTSRLSEADNIRCVYRPHVVECTIGPRSDLMVLAAMDEKQDHLVEHRIKDYYPVLVQGLKRAAARGGPLQGKLLGLLIRHDMWDTLFELGADDKAYHRIVRGNRPKSDALSEAYTNAVSLAEHLAKLNVNVDNSQSGDTKGKRQKMAFDARQERFIVDSAPSIAGSNSPNETRDLEAIVTLLELAAITLTETPSSTFTKNELLVCARDYAGPEIDIRDSDVDIVLEKASFLKSGRDCFSLK